MVAAVFLGFGGGLLGAFFIIVNNKINILRKHVLKQKWQKIADVLIIIVLTTTTMYLAAYIKYAAGEDSDNNTDIC